VRREILIDSASGEIRAAVLEDDLLAEVFIERHGRLALTGNVYKGRVSNVLPGMQSAFVDIGLERDAFLYVEDFDRSVSDPDAGIVPSCGEPGDASPSVPPPRPAIEDVLKEGQDVVVQVTKDPLATKGARITSHLSLPGRFLVYLPGVAHIGVSRRITDPAERERLKALVGRVPLELGLRGGFIVRTAAEDQDAGDVVSDARHLADLWEEVRRRAESLPSPALLHAEVGAVAKVLRDVFHGDVQRVLIDTEEVFREAADFVARMQPALVPRIHLHDGGAPLFEERAVQHQLDRALRPRVWLASGGSIVINQTEALVAIDVNTGKYVGRRRLEETILKTNLEAVSEIVRQVRLRDLGGIIVVDFIDMQEETSREQVIRALETEIRKDRARSRMLQISEFGLVEITRQRTRPSLERLLCRPCPACGGSGRVKSAETLYFEIVREARRLSASAGAGLVVRVHPGMTEPLERAHATLAGAPGAPSLPRIEFRGDPDLSLEQYRVAGA